MKVFGPCDSQLVILKESVPYTAISSTHIMGEYESKFYAEKMGRIGFHHGKTLHIAASSGPGRATPEQWDSVFGLLQQLPNARVVIPLGEAALNFMTGRRHIDKWQCSPLDTDEKFRIRKCVPCYDIDRVNKDLRLQVLVQMAFEKASMGLGYDGPWTRKKKNFHLDPDWKTLIELLDDVVAKAEILSVDIETGRGQINTMGFAWSPNDALAIRTLPQYYGVDRFWELWSRIAHICESPQKKIYQNNPYETVYLSSYGIQVRGTWHDTQWAQKFLWPEFEKGLDTVGRFYTDEPYWKDLGRVGAEEGKRKDWAHIPDWHMHLLYNAHDTANTYEAMIGQREDLEERGLLTMYDNYIMRLADPIAEMCCRGLPLNPELRSQMADELNAKVGQIIVDLNASTAPHTIANPASPKQKLHFLQKVREYEVPKSRNANGTWTPGSDELTLKKLRLKHPNDEALRLLIEYAKHRKALGSYVNIDVDPRTNRIYFILDAHGTETGRFTGYLDPWERGFNPLTLSKGEAAGKAVNVKSMFDTQALPPDYYFFEPDLDKAETWFVAMDSAETVLIEMLRNGTDIHRYVASKIYNKPMEEISKAERQLGKKSGHGANYRMSPPTFQQTCLKEMDVVLTLPEAKAALEGYFQAFPLIRQWQRKIEREVRNKRMLTNPIGRVRYFYGRADDSMYREACAYRPQSTIPDVTNHLMFYLLDQRARGTVNFMLHLQTYDSLLLVAHKSQLPVLYSMCKDYDKWHPIIDLPGGRLVIPTAVEIGTNWGKLKDYHGEPV